MSTLTYVHDDKEEVFSGEAPSARSEENGDEYKIHLQALPRIKEAIEASTQEEGITLPICLGNIDNELLKHLCADASLAPLLLREKAEIDNFPDCVLVYEDALMICEHFHVDASQQLTDKGKSSGTEYQQLINTLPSEAKRDLKALEMALEEKGTIFSTASLELNLRKTWRKKLKKIPKYIEAVCAYMTEQTSKGIGLAHIPERKEVWFVIEDVSPTCGFALIGRAIADLLEGSPDLSGIILMHIPNPLQLDARCEGIAFVKNDERAREQLRSLRL